MDGSLATAWTSGADPATATTLTVQLPDAPTIGRASVVWQKEARPLAAYTLQARSAGTWRTVATVHATTGTTDTVSFTPIAADAVRLRLPATRLGGQNPRLVELIVAA